VTGSGVARPELARARAICMAFPDTTERLSHGTPTWFAGGKRQFVQYWDDHHSDGRVALWCRAPDGAQAALVAEDPGRFFVPPYVGPAGWLGVRLDVDVDWDEIAAIAEDAWRQAAPARLLALFDATDRSRHA